MARTSKIDDPVFAKAVALAYIEGLTRTEMCEQFGVKDPDTITSWQRDPRVKAHANRFAQERIQRIIRKTDTEIERRLERLGQEDIDTILKVRKEYLNNAIKINLGDGATSETINDTMEALEDSPELAADLAALLDKAGKGGSK